MTGTMQLYQQPLMDGMVMDPSIEELMDASMSSSEDILLLSPSDNSNINNNTTRTSGYLQLTPNRSCDALKPIMRRRSRASKRTPITLLKANTSNFRAIVQQFTGCPTTISSLPIHKGPITLNFQQGATKQHIHHRHHHTKISTTMPPNQVSVPPLPSYKQSGYCLPTSGNSYRPISCMDDGSLYNNDFSLHELAVNAIFTDVDGLFI